MLPTQASIQRGSSELTHHFGMQAGLLLLHERGLPWITERQLTTYFRTIQKVHGTCSSLEMVDWKQNGLLISALWRLPGKAIVAILG